MLSGKVLRALQATMQQAMNTSQQTAEDVPTAERLIQVIHKLLKVELVLTRELY